MKQCFGYTRVSTAKQGEGVSLDAQKEAIEAFAVANSITISAWFEEKETAAKLGRPIFGTMIKQLKAGKAAGLVIHKIDRSARNFSDWAKIGDLSDSGIDVFFASESLDFRSRGGRLSADIQAVIAADYIRNLREETIKGLNGRLKQGLYPFKSPIGYLDNGRGKPKTPDPIRSPFIQNAFELYASGQHSLRSLLKEMTELGLRNERNKPLSKRGIETVLNNPFYTGLIRIKTTGNVYKGIHEPLISTALYERVQDVKSGKCGKKVTKHNHIYRGLFRCKDCDAAMTPERQKGHVYYRCQTPTCPTKTIREESIEQAIKKLLQKLHLTDEDISTLTADVQEWCNTRVQSESDNTLALQMSQVDDRLERLTDALIDRLIDKDTFNGRKQSLMLAKAPLEEKASDALKKQDDPQNVQKFLELIKNLAQTYVFAKPQEKRIFVELTTSNRFVSGRNVYLEPANWLVEAERALAVLCGDPQRPTSRTKLRYRKSKMEDLIEISRSDEVAEAQDNIKIKPGDAVRQGVAQGSYF